MAAATLTPYLVGALVGLLVGFFWGAIHITHIRGDKS
jgi:hypothetical protein